MFTKYLQIAIYDFQNKKYLYLVTIRHKMKEHVRYIFVNIFMSVTLSTLTVCARKHIYTSLYVFQHVCTFAVCLKFTKFKIWVFCIDVF